MKISIITIALNNEKDIEQTILSVINQTYEDVEYIIVDGASKDNTMNIVNKYREHIAKQISESDINLYDAINKGIKMATGEIVGLIHAGDRLYDNNVLTKINRHFLENDIDISYGHSIIVNHLDIAKRINKSPEYKRSLVRWGWMPSHQSIYIRREIFEKFGFYRTDLGGAGDYELFIRYFYLNRFRIKRLDAFIVKFSLGGMSTKSYFAKLQKKHIATTKRCWEVNGYKPPLGIIYLKWIRKPQQFIRALFYQN
jgi:glycosyltransferase involved in cell wall biosynthesis